LLVVAMVALLLFGNKLPSVMHSLGKSLSGLKRGIEDTREQVRKSIEDSDTK
jgi:sec-independent protein translocase protein TatA